MFKFFFRMIFGKSRKRSPRFTPKVARAERLLEVQVLWVHDGDGFKARSSQGDLEIRLYGVDAPEFDQPWGEEAKNHLLRRIMNRQVYLETFGQDIHGRTLATVFVMTDGQLLNINEDMVVCGQAWYVGLYAQELTTRRKHHLKGLDRWARLKRVGLWKMEKPIPPWEWRKRNSA